MANETIDFLFNVTNGDTGETAEFKTQISTSNSDVIFAATQLVSEKSPEALEALLRGLLGNPDQDGSSKLGAHYGELLEQFSNFAWNKLGWGLDTTVTMESATYKDERVSDSEDEIYASDFTIQLFKDNDAPALYLVC